jgi:TonB family protein
MMRVNLDRHGVVRSVRVVRKAGYGFDEVAVKAMYRFKFSPAVDKNGRPVDLVISYRYTFRLTAVIRQGDSGQVILPRTTHVLAGRLSGRRGRGLVLVAGLLLAGSARAQTPVDERSFDVQLFHAPIGPHSFITLDSARAAQHKALTLSLVSNYQRGPFQVTIESNQPELAKTFSVVQHQATSELAVGMGLFRPLRGGHRAAGHLLHEGERLQPGERAAQRRSVGGGHRRHAHRGQGQRWPPSARQRLAFALLPGATLPTGDGSKFLGDKSVTGRCGPCGVRASRASGPPSWPASWARAKTTSFNSHLGSQFLYGLAAEFKPHKDLACWPSGRGGWARPPTSTSTRRRSTAGCGSACPTCSASAWAPGAGSTTPSARLATGPSSTLGWTPDFRDADGDGVSDAEDRCPNEPEDRDGYKDGDGCPDPDNDGDGIPDAQDKCPNDAEDLDQFQDEDGCPEPDNDADGIPDLNDPLPQRRRGRQGEEAERRLPSSNEDSDGDGVPDARDKCPTSPRTATASTTTTAAPTSTTTATASPTTSTPAPTSPRTPTASRTPTAARPDNDKDGVPDVQGPPASTSETLNGNKDDDGLPRPGRRSCASSTTRSSCASGGVPTSGGKPQLTPGSAVVMKLVGMSPARPHRRSPRRAEVTRRAEPGPRRRLEGRPWWPRGWTPTGITAVGKGLGPQGGGHHREPGEGPQGSAGARQPVEAAWRRHEDPRFGAVQTSAKAGPQRGQLSVQRRSALAVADGYGRPPRW